MKDQTKRRKPLADKARDLVQERVDAAEAAMRIGLKRRFASAAVHFEEAAKAGDEDADWCAALAQAYALYAEEL